jgi:hypothetical protein
MASDRGPRGADSELLQQLEAARERGAPVEAVVSLRAEKGSEYLSTEQTEKITQDLLSRVERKTGVTPERLNVFRNLGSFVVSARPAFVQELLEQPEIEGATANRRGVPVVEPLGRASSQGED